MTIDRTLRPVRLAFLIAPGDFKALKMVIQINSVIWGGKYNFVIQTHRRLPSWLKKELGPDSTVASYLNECIAAFKPDYLVKVDGATVENLDFPSYRMAEADTMLQKNREGLAFGLSVTEIYRYLYQDQFKFSLREPPEVLQTSFRGPKAPFLSACFGAFPNSPELEYFSSAYERVFKPKHLDVTPESLIQSLRHLFPLTVGSALLRKFGGSPRYPIHELVFFYMNSNSFTDLVDFWNLRAFGLNLIPVPCDWALKMVRSCQHVIQGLTNVGPHDSVILQKSRACDGADLEYFAKALSKKKLNSRLALRHWFPPLWKYRDHRMDPQRCEVSAANDTQRIVSFEGELHFELLEPPRENSLVSCAWANELDLSVSTLDGETAKVIPDGIENIDSIYSILGGAFDCWTAGKRVTVVSKTGFHSRMHWKIPTSDEVFGLWLKQRGYQSRLSSAGKITRQMLRNVGGIWGTYFLTYELILKKLIEMAGRPGQSGPTVHLKEMLGLINRAVSERGSGKIKKEQRGIQPADLSENLLGNMLRHKVLKVGLQVRCPTCSRNNWYPVNLLLERLECDHCLENYSFPSASPPKDDWHYRAIGPFSIPGSADGAYAVLLAMRFLSLVGVSSEVTMVPSFEIMPADAATSSDKPMEVDFAAFLRGHFASANSVKEPVFGECKTYNEFKPDDIEKMRRVACVFPGSTIAFCCLRTELTTSEKHLIGALALEGRKTNKLQEWQTPVMVLTAREMFAVEQPPHCWEPAEIREAYRKQSSILGLSAITQSLYLGLERPPLWR